MTELLLRVDLDGPSWVEFARYANGDVAIVLRAAPHPDSEALCKATVCLDQMGCELAANEVWIKTWSENVGVAEALIAAGVVEPTGRAHEIGRNGGRVVAVHARLTARAQAEFARQAAAAMQAGD